MPGINNFFGKPIGAMPGDIALGEIDGSPIYRAPNGVRYYEQYQPVPPLVPTEALTTTMDSQGRGIHTRAPQERPAGYDMITGVAGEALRGLTAPGRALRGEPVTYGDAWTTALDYGALSAPTSAPEGALRGGGIRAYHGSPHDFDRFSMDKIGTGEGAQAYGHGLYFAESEDVARGYRDALTKYVQGASKDAGNQTSVAREARHRWKGQTKADALAEVTDLAQFSKDLGRPEESRFYSAVAREIRRTKSVDDLPEFPGHMYEVRINANPDDFLDWDAPLSEQPEAVRSVYNAHDGTPNVTGADIYRSLAEEGDAGTWMGAPGIKYKDGMSRGAEGGTRNFVVFDENLIEIVRKYGIAGAAAYLGMPEDELQQRMGNM